MSRTTRQPESSCPDCGKLLDAATNPETDDVPGPGDFGICIDCQGLHVFTETMGRRPPTEAELALLPLDMLTRYQRALTEVNKSR